MCFPGIIYSDVVVRLLACNCSSRKRMGLQWPEDYPEKKELDNIDAR